VKQQKMIKRRRRFKHTVPFKDRLSAFAEDLRTEANALPVGHQRDDVLMRARRAETAAHIEDWANSPGLYPPKVKR
jgi:hypothetical protein